MYHPLEQEIGGGRLFVHTHDRSVCAGAADHADRSASFAPINRSSGRRRSKTCARRCSRPNRVNALVFAGFAVVALTIAVVGVAGVLAFSVSARTREFGIRLAIGSAPSHLLSRVVAEGAVIARHRRRRPAPSPAACSRGSPASYVQDLRLPGVLPIIGAATLLVAAAVLASLTPAARAARVDVVRALRAE